MGGFQELIQQWLQTDELEDIASQLEGIKLLPVESSNLAAVGYDSSRLELVIAFLDGSIYRFEGVPKEEYDGLMSAPSHGEFFVDEIREVYPFERIAG